LLDGDMLNAWACVGRHNLSEEDVRDQLRCEDTIGTFPEFIDGYNILILPTTGRCKVYLLR
jgi:hypothetical protein